MSDSTAQPGLRRVAPDDRRCVGTVKNGDRKGQRCPKYAVHGCTVCRSHGAAGILAARGRSTVENVTHGLRSKFLDADDLTTFKQAVAAIKADDGADQLAAQAAFGEARVVRALRKNPEALDDPSGQEALNRIESLTQKAIEARARILAEKAGDTGTTINIVAPNLTAPALTPVRGPHGLTSVTQIDGRFYMLDRDGSFRPAQETTTEEGASLWVFDGRPVLEAHE